MRSLVVLFVAVVAFAVPVAAMADDSGAPTAAGVASQTCAQLKTSIGAAAFAAKYGTNAGKSNAFGRCVSANAKAGADTVANAAQACKAERANDPAAFTAKYGTNGKPGTQGAGKNAFGKCVSAAVKKTDDAKASSIVKAAASCKAALKADAGAFASKYGSTKNALGKCVSAASKTK